MGWRVDWTWFDSAIVEQRGAANRQFDVLEMGTLIRNADGEMISVGFEEDLRGWFG